MKVTIETNTSDYIWTANGRAPLPHEPKVFQMYNEWESRAQQTEQLRERVAPHFEQGVNILVGRAAAIPDSARILEQ